MRQVLKQLTGHTAIYGMSSIIGRLLNYLLVPLYTRVLVTSGYGIVNELYAYIGLLLVLLTFGMETTYFRFTSSEADKSRVYDAAFLPVFVLSVVAVFFVVIFRGSLAYFLDYEGYEHYFIWFVLILALDSVSAIPFARLRNEQRALRFAMIKLAGIVLNIVLNLFFLVVCRQQYLQHTESFLAQLFDPARSVEYIFIANFASSLLVLLLLRRELFCLRFRYDKPLLRRMLSYTWPLVITGLAGILPQTFDRFLIKKLITVPVGTAEPVEYVRSQIGIYGANAKLAVFMNLFIQAFRYAAEPIFFGHADKADAPRLYALSTKFFTAFGLLVFLLISMYLGVFQYYIGADYREGLYVVPVLLVGNLLLGINYNLAIWYKVSNRTRAGAWINVCGSVLFVLLNILLIPRFGYQGAAWAFAGSLLFILILSYTVSLRYYPIPFDLRSIGLYVLAAAAIFVCDMWFARHLSGYLLYVAKTILFAAFFAFFLQRERILQRIFR